MKKSIVLFIGMILSLSMYAQEDEIQTIFGSGTRISGFGGPFMDFTSINTGSNEFAHMMGGGGGVLLGNFFFGGYGEGLTNYIDIERGGPRMNFGHGGFWTGYSFFAHKAVHPCISTQIGWGSITQVDNDNNYYEPDNVFVVNPTIELEMNFLRFFRLSIGANYRLVKGVNTLNLTDKDLSSPGVFLAFKFGWF